MEEGGDGNKHNSNKLTPDKQKRTTNQKKKKNHNPYPNR